MSIRASKLLVTDLCRLGAVGLRARPTRLILSALGIAIGIAAMIAVVGISTSSRAALNAQLDHLGTNLLRVTTNDQAPNAGPLPIDAAARINRLPGTTATAGMAELDAHATKNVLIGPTDTLTLDVATADRNLLSLLGTRLAAGRAPQQVPDGLGTAMLGSLAADRIGISNPGAQIRVNDVTVTIVAIAEPFVLAPDLDATVFIDPGTARRALGWNGHPTAIFERSSDEDVTTIRTQIPGTVAPGQPAHVQVSRPSDVLEARAATNNAFTGMLIGLSGVALLVGGIGVANTMVIAVLERRHEIGLRRALGATRQHIRLQFLVEALLLSAAGGALGAVLGTLIVAGAALANGWILTIPFTAYVVGVSSTLMIGAIAGAYPALRAATTPPTVALAT